MNVQTFMIIRRRQRLSPRLQNRRSQLLNDQAARQSYVLLAILVVYGICHIPSFVLGILRMNICCMMKPKCNYQVI